MISRTLYATGDSDARYTLNGLMFHMNPKNETATIVGTDGHRLSVARKRLPDAGRVSEERKLILPKKAATEIRKLTEGVDGHVKLVLASNHMVFELTDIVLITRLIEGSYPNYEQVIPKNNEKKMKVDREEMLGAVRRASLLGREKTFPVKVELKDGSAVFSSNNPDVGEATEQLSIKYDSSPLTLGFNARYMMDALQNLPGEDVVMELQDSLSPTILRQSGDEEYFCVIMPMRI
jgi:DNA polymerase-3 subunit beta